MNLIKDNNPDISKTLHSIGANIRPFLIRKGKET